MLNQITGENLEVSPPAERSKRNAVKLGCIVAAGGTADCLRDGQSINVPGTLASPCLPVTQLQPVTRQRA
jgi:hypothetical protein